MSRRLLVLHLLREAGSRGITTSEFLQAGCGSRFGARVQELREQGHVIESERVRDGMHRYTLTFDVERDAGATVPGEPAPSPDPASGCGVVGEGGLPPAASSVSLGADTTAPPVGADCGRGRPANDESGPPGAAVADAPPVVPAAAPLFDSSSPPPASVRAAGVLRPR